MSSSRWLGAPWHLSSLEFVYHSSQGEETMQRAWAEDEHCVNVRSHCPAPKATPAICSIHDVSRAPAAMWFWQRSVDRHSPAQGRPAEPWSLNAEPGGCKPHCAELESKPQRMNSLPTVRPGHRADTTLLDGDTSASKHTCQEGSGVWRGFCSEQGTVPRSC